MLETLKIVGSYILSIGLIFIAVIGVFVCIGGAFIYVKNQFTQKPRTFKSVIFSSVKSFFVVILSIAVAFTLIGVSVTFLVESETSDYEHRMDKRFEEMTHVEEDRVEHVLVEISKSNRRSRGGGSRNVHYYVKNYNDSEFKGVFTLFLTLDGKIIDQKKVDIQLKHGELADDTFFSSDFDIPFGSWNPASVEYTIEGEFIQ